MNGLASQWEIALPILERRGIKAFWFICLSVLQGGIDRNEVYNYFEGRYFDTFDDFFKIFSSLPIQTPNYFGRCTI